MFIESISRLPRPASRRARRVLALLLAVTVGVGACKSIEKALPYLIVAGGAIASVVALNFLSKAECGGTWAVCDAAGALSSGYTQQVLLTIGTLTTVAGAAADYFVDQRQKKRELADLEKADQAVQQQYGALQAAQPQGNAAGWTTSWGAPAPGSEPARWNSVAPTPAFQESGGANAWGQSDESSANPWGNKYGNSGVMPRVAPAGPLALDVAMIKRAFVAGREKMIAFADGAVLLDGRGENVEDRFRLYFSPSEDAYVYVVGVDAVGRVQPLFPRRFPDQTNPIRAGERVLLPDGTNWYGLDEYSGIQHIFFRASREPLRDLEMQLTLFAVNPPPALPTEGKVFTVSEAMKPHPKIQGRGITGTEVEAVKLPPEIGDLEFVPERTEAASDTEDVATVRYFQHG